MAFVMRPALRHLAFKEKIAPRGPCFTTRYQERCRQTLHACTKNIPEKCEFLVHDSYYSVFFSLKSCEVAALFCCLDLYSVGLLLRTSQVWPHSILGCLDLFRSPSQSQGGSQRPWSLSSFSRADPKSFCLYMKILIGMDVMFLWCSFQ